MYYIIANPTAGRKKKNKPYEEVVKYLKDNNVPHELHETQAFEDPIKIAKELCEKHPEGGKIIVIGGDGTINEVVNGIIDLSKWEIGIIPAGSGNDIATKIGIILKKPIEALKTILFGKTKPIDIVDVNGMKCVNIAGTGIDIDVLLRFERYKKLKGSFRYLCALLVTLLKFKWYTFKVSVDDKPFETKTGFIAAACNGSQYGGGIRICKDAIVDDGIMDYVFCKKVNRLSIIFYLIQLMRGKIQKYKLYERQLCKKIVFESDKEFYLNVDGKIIKNTRFECKILPKQLNIYRP